MQIVSHYPNVPVATSNVATDSVRTDNQQKPPLPPPQETAKTSAEKALEQRQDRATEQQQERLNRIAERGAKQQHQQAEQQQPHRQPQLPQAEKAALMKLAAKGGALNRRDVRDRTQSNAPAVKAQAKAHPMPNEAPKVYRRIGAVIAAVYRQSSEVPAAPELSLTL
ncbi:hypothetical protein [Shewanella sp. GXUN23E]|uniref:hypothetical protein n=1 Tax=Shewanella sp. GXUN23E TaxID=3422498 RepID=UPI003D7D18CF